MKNYIVKLTDGDFSELEKEFKIVKIHDQNSAFIFCNQSDVKNIKKLSNFVSINPDNESTICDFKLRGV